MSGCWSEISAKPGKISLLLAVCAVTVVSVLPSSRSVSLPVTVIEQLVSSANAAQERAFVQIERARGLPVRGQSRASVQRQFGEPNGSKPAVGQPPISSWRYSNFTVYFEYNHVITTVADQDLLPTRLDDIQ